MIILTKKNYIKRSVLGLKKNIVKIIVRSYIFFLTFNRLSINRTRLKLRFNFNIIKKLFLRKPTKQERKFLEVKRLMTRVKTGLFFN